MSLECLDFSNPALKHLLRLDNDRLLHVIAVLFLLLLLSRLGWRVSYIVLASLSKMANFGANYLQWHAFGE